MSVQAQILNLLKDLQKEFHYSFLFITHNLSVVHHIADNIAVMYLGKFVEYGEVDKIFSNPIHPYTKALISARSDIDFDHKIERIVLKGEVPSPIDLPSGCAFHSRCSHDWQSLNCGFEAPKAYQFDKNHIVWCNQLKGKFVEIIKGEIKNEKK